VFTVTIKEKDFNFDHLQKVSKLYDMILSKYSIIPTAKIKFTHSYSNIKLDISDVFLSPTKDVDYINRIGKNRSEWPNDFKIVHNVLREYVISGYRKNLTAKEMLELNKIYNGLKIAEIWKKKVQMYDVNVADWHVLPRGESVYVTGNNIITLK